MKKRIYSARIRVLLAMVLVISFCAVGHADDVTEAVEEAMEFYKKGDFTQAAGSLDYAAQLIRQKKGGQLEDVLPEPLPGWTAEDASSQAYGAAMMGGGVTAQRSFSKDGSSVTVNVSADSPLLQGMIMMISNPMFATSDGGKLEKVAGHRAIVKYTPSSRDGNVNIVYASRYLIAVDGDNVEKSDLTAYAEAVNYKMLDKLQ
jgi:hypothetical protein